MPYSDTLKAILNSARAIPGGLGLRPYTVAIRKGAWNGQYTGRGAVAEDFTPVVEANGFSPKIRELNSEELALSGLGKGSLRVGPITPDYPGGGGTPISVLKPALNAGETLHVLVTMRGSPEGGNLYAIKALNVDRALHWTMDVEPVE